MKITVIARFFQYWTTAQSCLIVIVMLAIPLITFGMISLYHPQVEQETYANLEAIARLKASQIENWLHERGSDAEVLLADEVLAQEVAEILRTGALEKLNQRQSHFDRLRSAYDYSGVCLVQLDGKLLLGSGDCTPQPSDSKQNLDKLKSGSIERSPLYFQTQNEVHIDWFIPIGPANPATRPLAVLILRTNAQKFLFPLIKAWPTASATGESLLVRQQGNDVVFLNELRFRENTALTMALPLTTPHLPTAVALLSNQPGKIPGIDYRGIEVMAAYLPVAGTNWKLIAKVDRAEVLAPLYQMARWIAFITFISALMLTLVIRKYSRERWQVEKLTNAAKDTQIELEQHRSDMQFASIFNLSPIAGIISLAEDGQYIQINENFKREFGWSEEEVIGQTSIETALWPDASTRNAFIEAFGQEERLTNYDSIMMTKDGRRLNVSLSSAIIEINSQRCLLTFVSDVTEHRAAQSQLLAAEASLKKSLSYTLMLLDAMMDAVICMDQDGRVTTWNTHAEKMFSYPAEKAIGRLVEDLIIPPAYRERHRQGMARFVKTGMPQIMGKRLELPGMRADGTEFPIELTIGSIGEHGQLLFSAAIRDISERKAQELHLRKLSIAIEQSTSSVAITDIDGNIEYVNDAFTRATGYSPEEAIGQNPRILQSGFTPRETYIDLWATLDKGNIWRGELYNKAKDGHMYTESAQITPLHDASGKVTNYIAVKEDITEKKRLNEELAQHRNHLERLIAQRTEELHVAMQRADTANQAKSAFLANMSHEIRTPMNAIVGLTHLLRRSTLVPEQRQQLDKITGAAGHLLTIINNILDLSKIESAKLQLEQIDFNLGTLFENVRSMLLDAAQKKGLDFKIDYADTPLWLRGDPTRLQQSLLNFASNAIKFTRTGFVTMRARVLAETDAGIQIRIEVEDSGAGISAENQAKLFNNFEQADTSTTRQYGGTGLGLAITRRLAALMGGEAGVSSQLGQGSTFWLTALLQRGENAMPTQDGAIRDTAESNAEARLHRFAGTRILLADDVEINRELCIALLDETGLIIDTAADGREALNKATTTDYAVILMDMQMPVMDGLEATRAILKLPGRTKTAIIAMTANAFDEDRHTCEQAGMVDFVPKPIDPELLFQTLALWLTKSAALVPQPQNAIAARGALQITPTEPLNDASGDALPGLDLTRGLATWGGKVELYQKFLVKFSNTYADAAQTMRRTIESNDRPAAVALAHKLKGAASNMPLPDVTKIAGEIERFLKLSTDETAADNFTLGAQPLLAQLDQALAIVLNSIARYAPSSNEMEGTAIITALEPTQQAIVTRLLQSLLEALDTNDPAAAEPVLEQLAKEITMTQLQAVHAALDDFDFRSAEAATRQLAADLNLSLDS